ncbi:hypothetical protein ACFY0G_45445 [Streptomyces sp. NPDC001552]|uniref:hypothetical protein n=1 Tax=Streptomyces sp. NPDC001552 TaxID=3364587 RepID=UPI0036BF4FCD
MKPVPSAGTVAALASALKEPVEELLALRWTAAQEAGTVTADGPGRPIELWEPHDLEVHPAGPARTAPGLDAPAVRGLPGYVPRDHDRVLAEAVRDAASGRSRIVVLVGTSSTGKTRACWEAVQPLVGRGWRLWHPFAPARAEAALEDLHQVRPRTVVWLNEAQHYLGNPASGERIAAAVRDLLAGPERGPVLVLGTLWPEYARQYTAMPTPGTGDSHSQVRELLSGRTLAVPDAFDTQALAAAAALAESGDRLLGDALTRARADGRVTQDLAGAPELLNRYQHATPAAKALLDAAMDARRLGVGIHLPQTFLTDAAPDYLTGADYDQLADDWAEQAFAELSKPVHGKHAPLRRTTPRPPQRPPTPTTVADTPAPPPAGLLFRLADYLEEHGRTTRRPLCPPASFWHAAHTHLTHPSDLIELTHAAEGRFRLQWAHHLRHRAAEYGHPDSLYKMARIRVEGGDREGGEHLLRQAAGHGNLNALVRLSWIREIAGDPGEAETLAMEAAGHGETYAVEALARMREKAGDRQGLETLAMKAADHGNALVRLAQMREIARDWEGAENLITKAADHGHPVALGRLALMREEAGDRERAEALAVKAADGGNPNALYELSRMLEGAGDEEGAERLLLQAADYGDMDAVISLVWAREEAGDREGAEALAMKAANHGDPSELMHLAKTRADAGDQGKLEHLLRQAVDCGHPNGMVRLTEMRERAGDGNEVKHLPREVADYGQAWGMQQTFKQLWPHGLDPDGTPTPAWQPSVSVSLGRHIPPGTL